MALLPSELIRLKVELGYNALTIGAEPYVAITSLFDQIILPYLSAGAITTSSTSVSPAVPPGPLTIVLGSANGFASGARVAVDVDSRQETVTIESLSGTSLTAIFAQPHSGTYSVTIEGGESIIRELLANIRAVKAQMAITFGAGTLKQVDEIQFYATQGNQTLFGALGDQLMYWRDELASALGIRSMWRYRQGGASRLSVY